MPAFSNSSVSAKNYKIAYFRQALEHPGLDPEIRTAVQGLIGGPSAGGCSGGSIEFNLLDQVVPTYLCINNGGSI